MIVLFALDSVGLFREPPIVSSAYWAPLTAFAAALLATWWLAHGRAAKLILDTPNSRSLHDVPVPRSGGIGIFTGALPAIGIIAPPFPATLWIALAIMIAISLLDDIRGVAPGWRLLAHAVAGGLIAETLLGSQGIVAVVLATLAIVWMANLYNFMDGSDGLAAGMAIIGFSFYALSAWLAGNAELALVSAALAAAALAFLVFNFPPARIFLGDAGAVPLGFLAAALGMLGWMHGDWTWWFPFLVFGPFVADASTTLLRRLARLEKVWQAHRDHYYQRLVRMGWGHRRTAVVEYALMVASGTAAALALRLPGIGQAAVLAGALAAYLSLIAAVEFIWCRNGKDR
jgi:UDP-N-acetylmuramyl pentapeptide phosphotransferase/UDP-N-acetylglucosamine-1-phosphate transferase